MQTCLLPILMLNPFFEKTRVGQFHEIILHICFNSLFHSKLHKNGLVLYQCLSKGVGISSTLPHQIKYPIFIEAKVILTSKNEECKIKLFPSILLLICFYLSCYLFHTCWWKNTKAHFKNISLSTHCIKGSRLVS